MANGWIMDQAENIEIFRIPQGLCLESTGSGSATLSNMPYDILLAIFDNIDLSDRLCLGLTCKILAYYVTVSPRVPFIYEPYTSLTPEWYTLIPRLAKGWVPKDQFKWCWKCNKIRPRDELYFERALSKDKGLRWLWKLNLTEGQWARMKFREKREHVIVRWLTENLTIPARPAFSKVYYPDFGVWVDCRSDTRGPECPLCLERELVYACQRPRGLFDFSVSTRTFLANKAELAVDLVASATNTAIRRIRSLVERLKWTQS